MSAATPLSASAPLPRHLAIIMDGNGRWAQRRQRPRVVGHRAGARAVNLCVDYCLAKGIATLTLFAFSSENWQRPAEEVGSLMQLFLRALEREVTEMHRRGVRLRFIGDQTGFSDELRKRMRAAERLTAANIGLTLNVAVGYGGRWDIVEAAKSLARASARGTLDPEQIDADMFSQALGLADLPEPDLFIRTGGEYRLSNFLLWHLAYTELWFTPCLWPDLSETILDQALVAFRSRDRRFGNVADPTKDVACATDSSTPDASPSSHSAGAAVGGDVI
ncbi:MAG: polyprenyl diphosphate synthase [Xanthomonadaceae bacterium]|nr:polyprenyl diphosphate synthase [Xanthomonadaceae bacterium]